MHYSAQCEIKKGMEKKWKQVGKEYLIRTAFSVRGFGPAMEKQVRNSYV